MALVQRCVKINHFFSPKTFNFPHFLSYIFHGENPVSKSIPTAQSNQTQNFSVSVDVSLDRGEIINGLTANFTKLPFFRKNEELKVFGERLTTDIVETVLRGLKSWKIAYEFFLWAGEQEGYKHNCYTYNAMATILSRARQTTKLKVLATDIVNSRCYMTAGALGFFIRCLGGLGMIEEANYIFDQLKKLGLCVLNSYSYNCLLEALAKASQVELVEKRLKEMSDLGWNPDKFTLTPVLQVYCNAGKFEEALVVFNQIYDNGWMDEHVLTILVISFSKWGEIDKAFELIERMEDLNVSLNEKTMCLLVHGFSKELRVDKALQVFDKMQRLGFSHDRAIYSVLIDGLCKKKEFGKALDLHGEMKKCGIFPDVNLLVKLISSLCAEGDLITANQLVVEGEEGMASEAQTLLYNAVLEGLVNHGLVEKAYLLLQSMMGVGCDGETVVDNLFEVKKGILPNTASFSIVIDGLCKTGKLDLALGLFSDMARIGCKRSLLLYNNLINELCNSDRLEEGLELLSEMKEFGFEPTSFTHNCLFGCLCRRENVSGAVELLRRMRSRGHEPWIKHSSMLVKQLCKHGKAVEACKFLNNMVQEGFLPDIIAYSAAIDGLFKIKEVDQAMELFRDISVRGYRPDLVAYNILIGGLCKVGKVSQAQEFLNEMLEKGLLPSVITYNLMIDGLCKMNEIDEALVFFKRMVDEAREPTVITYTTLIDGLCNAGRHEDAIAIWDEMREKRCTPNRISYMALVHGLCKCNKTEVALVYFCEMEEKEMKPDAFVFVALISGFMSDGNLLMAFEILKKMVQEEAFPSHSDKNYPILLDVLCKLSEDPSTSSDVKNLIAEGCIPAISCVSEIGIVAELASHGLILLTLAVQFLNATGKIQLDYDQGNWLIYSRLPGFPALQLHEPRNNNFPAEFNEFSHWIEIFPTVLSPLLLRLPQETKENGILFKDSYFW